MKPITKPLTHCGIIALSALALLAGGAACKSIGFPTLSAAAQTPAAPGPSDYRRLQDVVYFDGALFGQVGKSDGGATLETRNGGLAVDGAEKYDGKDVIPLRVSGAGGSWMAKIARNYWLNSDLTQYVAHGVVQFAVKGASGAETFALSLSDMNGHESSAIHDFAVTKDWQIVRVPLSALLPAGTAFRAEKLQTVNFQSVGAATPQNVFIADIRVMSPDAELAAPPVKVNQLGFAPGEPKRAIVSGFGEELRADDGTAFAVKDAATGKTAYSGKLKLVADDDAQISGERVLSADFSALKTPGRYVVSVAGVGDSVPFAVAPGLYEPLVRDTARYFYYQRSGMALDAAHAGKFVRGIGHPQDKALAFKSAPDGATRDVSGGWYDAGDYGKYVSMCAPAVSDLMWAYELFPGEFKDGALGIPESGNGKPDLLDEIHYELAWVLKMQDAESGGFYQKVWPNNANVTPDKDPQPRYIYDKVGDTGNVRPTASTANAAAILARASVLYKLVDPAFAARCLASAEKGWAYLTAHPDNIVATGMTGADTDDSDNCVWAAGELFRATNKPVYGDYFAAHIKAHPQKWDDLSATGYGEDMSRLGCLAYMKSANPAPQTAAWIRAKYAAWRQGQEALYAKYPWTNMIQPGGYFWGSNCTALESIVLLAAGDAVIAGDNKPPVREARGLMNYLLGENPLRFSYISGYGENSVKHIYSCNWTNAGYGGSPKGYMPGGPNKFDAGIYSRFAAKCYRDVDTDWVSNENAIYYNSPLVFTAALVADAEKHGR